MVPCSVEWRIVEVWSEVRTKGSIGEQRLPHPRGELDRAVGRMDANLLEYIDDQTRPACAATGQSY